MEKDQRKTRSLARPGYELPALEPEGRGALPGRFDADIHTAQEPSGTPA